MAKSFHIRIAGTMPFSGHGRAEKRRSGDAIHGETPAVRIALKISDETVFLVHEDDVRGDLGVAELEAEDDDFLAFLDQVGGGAVHAHDPGSAFADDHVGLEPCPGSVADHEDPGSCA